MMKLAGGVQMARKQYLAGFKEGSRYPTVPSTAVRSEATFDGTIKDLAEKHCARDPRLKRTLFNDVKVCPQCGKPCAVSLANCNACGYGLTEVKESQSENVFSAFLFGVKRAEKGFPYQISLRHQSKDVLIFDDMLSLSPCHLNGISAKHYIPDWRFLLTDPAGGLRLLDTMERELWAVTLQFLKNDEFRSSVLKPGMQIEDLRGKCIKSFNYPPSQYQLHVQWQLPPLTPFHHHMSECHNHFHEGRAFPFSYVRKVLELNIPYDVKKGTPIKDITDFYDAKGVNYTQQWSAFYEKALQDSIECANWNPQDFKYLVEGGKAYRFSIVGDVVQRGEPMPEIDPGEVQKKDNLALQNYGRPYTKEGKASGTFISNPLSPTVGPGGYHAWPGVFEPLPRPPPRLGWLSRLCPCSGP